MLRVALLSLAAGILAPALAAQVPLGYHPQYHLDDAEEWCLDKLPNLNATDNLVFETVHSLLQHWPNTRMRNGHNIVPAIIPKGTLLYHGRTVSELPPGPEWVATDPEHSYIFCANGPGDFEQGCWHLTLATTRPLRVVYLDGSSAAKLPFGTMDTQNLVAWGEFGHHDIFDERQRVQDLCQWGKSFGVDGFVRMEMDFEIILCDFTSGVSVVAFTNLLSRWAIFEQLSTALIDVSFEAMNSGSWHNHFPGETRIQLDLAGLISFYDTKLAPSLVAVRAGQERWDHRVQNISSGDISTARSRLEEYLTRPGTSSGIDWRTLIQVIVDRFAGRIELARYLLNASVIEPDEIIDLANKTQSQLRIMLTPHLLLSAMPTDPSDKDDVNWAVPVYKLCATTHTRILAAELGSMTSSEKLILQAIRGTTQEICRVVTKMWAAGVYAGIDRSLNTKESPDVVEVTRVRNTWREDLEHLMGWLDWSVWVKCNPGCSFEEMCYLPTWPAGFPIWHKGNRNPTFPPSDSDATHPEVLSSSRSRMKDILEEIIKPESDDWVRPQPKCVRRFNPYDL